MRILRGMATAPDILPVPELTLGWRLRMALDYAELSVNQIARDLEVGRQTVSRWLHDDGAPKALYIRSWAEICGVDYDWLRGDKPSTRWLQDSVAS